MVAVRSGSSAAVQASPPLGAVVGGRFSLLRKISAGIGASVYQAAVLGSEGSFAALKMVQGGEPDEVLREFYEREASILSVLRHPHIVRLLAFGIDESYGRWLAFEWAGGGSLADRQARARFKAGNHVAALLSECLEALLYAHLERVIHRDIKPSNILFDGCGETKLADFSVSKWIGRPGSSQTLRTYLTPQYAAPEQLRGAVATERSDIFSLGLVAAELLLGRLPARDEPIVELLRKQDPNAGLRELVVKMVSSDPSARPTASEALSEVRDVLEFAVTPVRVYAVCSGAVIEKVRRTASSPLTNQEVLDHIRADLSGRLRLQIERRGSEEEGEYYTLVGTRLVYSTTVDRTDPRKQALRLISAALPSPIQYDRIRAEALVLPAEVKVLSSLDVAPITFCTDDLRRLVVEEQGKRQQLEPGAEQLKLIDLWERWLDVAAEVDACAASWSVRRVGFDSEKELVEVWAASGIAESDELVGRPVCYQEPSGRVVALGVVVDFVGGAFLVRPHDELSAEVALVQGGRLLIDIRREQASYERQRRALRTVKENSALRADLGHLLSAPHLLRAPSAVAFQALQRDLASSNKRVVELALGTDALMLIQGPPGTGKTTVIAELIGQLLRREPRSRILVASQSNVAVDNVLERLHSLLPELKAVRLGRTEKISREARQFELSRQVSEWVQHMRTRAVAAQEALTGLRRTGGADVAALANTLTEVVANRDVPRAKDVLGLAWELVGQVAHARPEPLKEASTFKSLTAVVLKGAQFCEAVQRLQAAWLDRVKAVEEFEAPLLAERRVAAATCIGFAANRTVQGLEFDWVIIDEAGRATPPELLVPMVRGRRFVLVGDHKQLPPMVDRDITAEVGERYGLTSRDFETSLFEQLINGVPAGLAQRLLRQYRMHPDIGGLIAKTFYPDGLEHGVSEGDRPLGSALVGAPLRWLDTSSHPQRGERQVGTSFTSPLEAVVIRMELETLDRRAGELGKRVRVAVLTGYAAQAEHLENELSRDSVRGWKNLEVRVQTIDAVQGKEFDFVFYSATRSNVDGRIGFLRDERRLNVALSRAREALTIVGDANTLCAAGTRAAANPFSSIRAYFAQNPAQRKVYPVVKDA